MNRSIKGEDIRSFRLTRGMTQSELAEKIGVTDKAISKWETGRGLPDISLVNSIAQALGLSVSELFEGKQISNCNTSSNMNQAKQYVCPLCENIILSTGEALVSCCGSNLSILKPKSPDNYHTIQIERIEDELYIKVVHPMSKGHHISFILYRTDDRIEMVKLYPESEAECRFFYRRKGTLLIYCNKHGLFETIL